MSACFILAKGVTECVFGYYNKKYDFANVPPSYRRYIRVSLRSASLDERQSCNSGASECRLLIVDVLEVHKVNVK